MKKPKEKGKRIRRKYSYKDSTSVAAWSTLVSHVRSKDQGVRHNKTWS
jgi:hypothetical protein